MCTFIHGGIPYLLLPSWRKTARLVILSLEMFQIIGQHIRG